MHTIRDKDYRAEHDSATSEKPKCCGTRVNETLQGRREEVAKSNNMFFFFLPRLSRNDTVNSFIYLLQLADRVCVATLPPTVQQYVPTFFKLWIWLWVLLILSLQMNFLFYLESIKPVHAWKTLEGGMRNG